MKSFSKEKVLFFIGILALLLCSFAFLYGKTDFLAELIQSVEAPPKPLLNPPAVIKAVYATGWSMGTKSYLAYLQNIFKTSQINAVVIDVKDVSGLVYYKSGADKVREYKTYQKVISDINGLIKSLHNQGIYVIARIPIFKDSYLAKARPDLAVYDVSKTKNKSKPVVWQDNNGLNWVDPSSQEVWDYNIAIAKDAASHGFDEINFDYIRFPSDGNLQNMGFPFWDRNIPRHIIIKNFSQKIREALPDTKLSIDLFGQTTTNTDDMGIGQLLEDSFENFDYVAPMVYPSHYINGFLGYANPADHPYEIVKNALSTAELRIQTYKKINTLSNASVAASLQVMAMAKIRPWLQDFNLGAQYDTRMVKQEIQATADSLGSDFNGFMMWNPLNFYTTDALK